MLSECSSSVLRTNISFVNVFPLPRKHGSDFTGLCTLVLCSITDNTQKPLAVWVGLMQDGTDANIACLLKGSWKAVSHAH